MLEPSADEICDWGNSVIQFMIEYLGGLRDRPAYRHTSSREIRNGLDLKLPIKGTDFDALLKIFRETIVPFSRQNAHPRMFGYVQSPGTPIGAFADLLASTLNANLTIWRSAPAPVELERLTIDWIRQILGFNAEAGGLFVSGGSMANLAALAAARQTKEHSLGRLRMYASSATHFSITKAAALLGIGRENVQYVALDECFKMRMDDLVTKITADLEAGYIPFCVVGNAGTVDTGAVDLLTEIREVRQIRSRLILINGFIYQWMSAASFTATPKLPGPLLLMRRSILACLVRRKTKPLYAGTTGRNCRGVSEHSKYGCC